MSEEKKEPVKETPPPASAEVTPAPVEGPKKILQELDKAAADPKPATPPGVSEEKPAAPEAAASEPAATPTTEVPVETPPAASGEPTPPTAETPPADVAAPQMSGMPLITDNMRRLDELLARFR